MSAGESLPKAGDTMTNSEITTLTAAVALGLLQAWAAYRQHKIAKTVDQIHTLTNSAMGWSKRTLAEVTSAKAAITKNPTDQQAADTAMADYLDHVSRQSKVDAGETSSKS